MYALTLKENKNPYVMSHGPCMMKSHEIYYYYPEIYFCLLFVKLKPICTKISNDENTEDFKTAYAYAAPLVLRKMYAR